MKRKLETIITCSSHDCERKMCPNYSHIPVEGRDTFDFISCMYNPRYENKKEKDSGK